MHVCINKYKCKYELTYSCKNTSSSLESGWPAGEEGSTFPVSNGEYPRLHPQTKCRQLNCNPLLKHSNWCERLLKSTKKVPPCLKLTFKTYSKADLFRAMHCTRVQSSRAAPHNCPLPQTTRPFSSNQHYGSATLHTCPMSMSPHSAAKETCFFNLQDGREEKKSTKKSVAPGNW